MTTQVQNGGYMSEPEIAVFSRAGSLPLVGSEIAFDLSNTSSGRGGPKHLEHLSSAADVIRWAQHARVINADEGAWLTKVIDADHGLARRLLKRTLDLREIIYAIGTALAAGAPPPKDQIDILAQIHANCLARAHLVPHDEGFVWSWRVADGPVERILGPIALSILTLLTQANLSRVKQCEGEHCGWIFFDTTKNKSRRWCEMEVCGNRAKQRRHHGSKKIGP
jgi:predicted RNA-binding Zn ribbon-like protein